MDNTVLTELLNANHVPVLGEIVMYMMNKVYSNVTIMNSATQWKILYPPIPIESMEHFEEEDDDEES